MSYKRKTYKTTANRIQNEIPRYFVTRYPHYVEALNNASKGYGTETHKSLFEPSEWRSTYPVLQYFSQNSGNNTTDITTELVNKKRMYLYKLDHLKLHYNKSYDDYKKRISANKYKNVYTRHVKEFIYELENDPDPNFNYCVDWYYTGGNIKIVRQSNQDYLFHVNGDHLNKLCASAIINKSNNQIHFKETRMFEDKIELLQNHGTIYELNSHEDNKYLTIRQKNSISILQTDNEDASMIRLDSGNPLVSSIYQSNNSFTTIDSKRNLKILDLNTNQLSSQGCLTDRKRALDQWCSLRNYKKTIFAYANRHSVALFDTRKPINPKSWSVRFNLKPFLDQCEDITCIEMDQNGFLAYVACTHNLFTVDVRYSKKNNLKMLKWTHQLKTPPMYMSILPAENKETVAFSGLRNGDIRIIECLHLQSKDRTAPNLPYKPRSTFDSLELARDHGKCLLPSENFSEHLNLSNTGAELYRIGKNRYNLFVQNSVGNITSQIISKEKIEEDLDEVVEEVEKWSQVLKESNQLHPTASIMSNFRSMTDVLKCGINMGEVEDERMPFRERAKWKRTIDELSSYTDVLAADILAQWDIETKINVGTSGTKETVNDTIHSWLNTTTVIETPQTTQSTVPEIVNPTVDTITLSEQPENLADELHQLNKSALPISQSSSLPANFSMPQDMDTVFNPYSIFETSTQEVKKSTKSKSKRKFVPGFC